MKIVRIAFMCIVLYLFISVFAPDAKYAFLFGCFFIGFMESLRNNANQ